MNMNIRCVAKYCTRTEERLAAKKGIAAILVPRGFHYFRTRTAILSPISEPSLRKRDYFSFFFVVWWFTRRTLRRPRFEALPVHRWWKRHGSRTRPRTVVIKEIKSTAFVCVRRCALLTLYNMNYE